MIAFLCISKRKKALRRYTIKKKQKTKTKGLYTYVKIIIVITNL